MTTYNDDWLSFPLFSADLEVREQNIHFTLDDPVDEIQQHILAGEFYEREQLDYHKSLIPRRGRVLDVGANIGNHAIFYAKVCEADLVVAVEPSRRACRLFARTLLQNAISQVELHEDTAAGAAAGWAMLDQTQAVQHNLGGTSIQLVAKRMPGAVRIRPGDEILGKRSVDFVKIDVEGAEMSVLTGLQQTFDLARPVLAIEVMPANRSAFASWCDNQHYRIERTFQMYRNVLNFVCVPIWT